MSRALATARGWLIASFVLMAAGAVAHGAEAVRAGDYRVTVNDEGRMAIKHGRVPLVTTSYIGMFDRLPSGSLVYYVDTRRELRCEKTGEEAAPKLILHNTGMRGVAMRREIMASPEGVTLVHDITVPLGVAGAVDTGFTLNPELVFGARVTCWPRGSDEPRSTKLGAASDALPYSTPFRKIVFESEWGKLSIEFGPGDRTQDYGALLNGEQSTKRKGLWAQVLPLSQGATADKALEAHKSVCVIRYEPTPGKAFLPAQRNCLYNGGFEDWANGDLPDGWRRSPQAERDTSAGLAPDSSARFEGKRSLRWILDAGELTHVISYRGYALPATLEAPCTFSVHVKSEPPGVRVALRCGHGREVVTASGQWQRFAVTATRGNSFPVAIEKLSAGALWLDAAQLEEGSQPTPFVARDKSSLAGHTPFPSDLMK
ncbi:MAG: hypothetical protein FJ279_36335, partial [Planctomycetes bacterium]|nr:hypothetical protein [Planctomycetota bacterium]